MRSFEGAVRYEETSAGSGLLSLPACSLAPNVWSFCKEVYTALNKLAFEMGVAQFAKVMKGCLEL